MGTERTTTLNIAFEGDDVDIRAILSNVKSQIKNTVAEIESSTSKLQLFGQLETNVPKVEAAMRRATDAVKALRAEADKTTASGGKIGDDLAKSLAAAEKAAAQATKEYARQNTELASLGAQLKARGVDVSNYAAAQTKLAASLKAAGDAAAVTAAKQALGITTLKDTEPVIQRLNAAYETLRKSGTLTPQELVAAQQQLRQRISETENQVTALSTASKAGGTNLAAMFTGSVLPALGITATIGGLVAALVSVVNQAKAVKQALAEIGTVTTLTPAQLDALGEGAKRLAVTIGVDVNDALRGLRELLQSGVPAGNALEVLEVAGHAAKASLSDLGSGVKAANLLLDAFGSDIGDLTGQFDKLLVAQHNGGVELKVFADNAGPLLNIARDAGVGFDELTAVLSIMANKSGDAAGAIGNLGKIIAGLQTVEAREKLDGLGISTRNLVEIFQELGKRNITLQQFLDLDIGSRKAAGSIAALTNNTELLTPALERARDALGGVKRANDALQDSPKERADRFNAQLQLASINIGNLVGSGSKLATVGAAILEQFNKLPGDFERLGASLEGADGGTNKMLRTLVTFAPQANTASEATKKFTDAQANAEKQALATEAAIKKTTAALAGVAERLLADVKSLQDATAQELAAINARAEAEIAALDRTKEATARTAAETVAIQLKAADDKLAAIKKNEAEITAAIEAAAAARSAIVQAQTGSEAKAAAEAAKVRIVDIGQQIKDFQGLYTNLTAQAQAHLARVAQLEQQRVDFNAGIEKQIFDLRLGGLSALDQYVEKTREVERLISEARIAGVNGDIAQATKFYNEAIGLARSLGPVYSANGAQIINSAQAQQNAVDLIRKAQQALNQDIERQKGLEEGAASELTERMKDVSAQLVVLQVRFNNLRNTIDQGFEAKIELDTASANKAIDDLNRITADRTVKVRVEVDTSAAAGLRLGEGTLPLLIPGNNAGGFIGRAIQALREGGTVGALVQRFANGGTVFRSPTWSKVPGSGDADTVPAALPVGSYVIRKAASQKYGDGIMGMLAGLQRFAVGGSVERIVDPGIIARQILSGSASKLGNTGEIGFGDPELHAVKVAAEQLFGKLLDSLAGLPHSTFGQDYSEYLRQVVEAIRLSTSAAQAHALYDPIAQIANDIARAAAAAKLFHVPLAYWPNAGTAAFSPTRSGPSEAFNRLGQNTILPVFGGSGGRAGGGLLSDFPGFGFGGGFFGFNSGGNVGGDRVPALLTPGEFVLRPDAVRNVLRLFGGGFLDAMNAMRVPSNFFAGMRDFAPPPRPLAFAAGGPVPGAPQSFASGGSVRGRAAGGVTLNLTINAQRVDEAEVRRSIIPAIERIMRRSK